jgi:hypothetical protein
MAASKGGEWIRFQVQSLSCPSACSVLIACLRHGIQCLETALCSKICSLSPRVPGWWSFLKGSVHGQVSHISMPWLCLIHKYSEYGVSKHGLCWNVLCRVFLLLVSTGAGPLWAPHEGSFPFVSFIALNFIIQQFSFDSVYYFTGTLLCLSKLSAFPCSQVPEILFQICGDIGILWACLICHLDSR